MFTKKKLIETLLLHTLRYQCQTWALYEKHKQKITTCEMRCVRKPVNKTIRDRIRNNNIRDGRNNIS